MRLSFCAGLLTLVGFLYNDISVGRRANAEWTVRSLKAPSAAAQKRIRDSLNIEEQSAAQPFPLLIISQDEWQHFRDQSPHASSLRSANSDLKSATNVHRQAQGAMDAYVEGQAQRADTDVYPFDTAVKIFATSSARGLGYCSGQFIGSPYVVMTAAHCVIGEDGTWNSNFIIVRKSSVDGSQIPVQWKCMSVLTAYIQPKSDISKDYAFILTAFPYGGYLGFTTDFRFADFESIGYPHNYENGRYLMRVRGALAGIDSAFAYMKDNPFLEGSSGGAWIGDLNPGQNEGNRAIGLNSFIVRDRPGLMGSPRFNIPWWLLWDFVNSEKCMS